MAAKSLIYEVSLEVDPAILASFDPWLQQHVQDMLRIEGFLSAEILREDADGVRSRRVVRYRIRDEDALEAYLRDHAEGMRQDGLQRFGKAFTASRRTFLAPLP